MAGATPEFPDSLKMMDCTLEKCGSGDLRKGWVFKVYDAAFYLEEGVATERYQENVPKKLTIRYNMDIKADVLTEAAEMVLNDLFSEDELAPVRDRIAAIDKAYKDVTKGDEYALFYHPSKGSTLLHNGTEVITIPGYDFAKVYFDIWLGGHEKLNDLSRELLGG